MKRSWMAAAAGLVLVTACQERDERALGVERGRGHGEPSAQPAAPGAEPKQGAPLDENKAALGRVLAVVQGMIEGEVESGKLATQRASSNDVKSFANMMVAEHQKDADEAKRLAKGKNLDTGKMMADDPILKASRAAHADVMRRLSSLSGPAFDGAYMAAMASGHLKMAKLTEEGQRLATDPELSGFFQRVNEEARHHEAKALALIPVGCGGEKAGPAGQGGGPTPGGTPPPGSPAPGMREPQPGMRE